MKKILITILLSLYCIVSFAQIDFRPLSISKKPAVTSGSFAQLVTLPSSSKVEIKVTSFVGHETSNISIITPSGSEINETNAASNNASFTLFSPQNEYEKLEAISDSWIITLNMVSAGEYEIKGSANSSEVVIDVRVLDSMVRSYLKVGEVNNSPKTNKPIPVALYLREGNLPVTNATATFELYKDNVLVESKSVQDNGVNEDPVASDGMYMSLFSITVEGVYSIVTKVTGTDNNGQTYESEMSNSFEVIKSELAIDSNYIEEANDTNGNNYFDNLILTFPITGTLPESGKFEIYGKIKLDGDNALEDFRSIDVIENSVRIEFDGKEIRKSGHDGEINVERLIVKHGDSVIANLKDLRNTAAYINDAWEREKLILGNAFFDEAVDLNGDGFFDEIVVRFDIDSIIAGYFGFSTTAKSSDTGNKAGVFGSSQTLIQSGINTLEFKISGFDFASLGENTALNIVNLFMYPNFNDDTSLELAQIGVTNQYNCWLFAGCTDGPNTSPEAVADFANTDGRAIYINAASNDIDADGDIIKVTTVEMPMNGTATIVGNSVQYTPNADFSGTESFGYSIVDIYPENNALKNGSGSGIITVTTVRNNPPIANDDTYDVLVDSQTQLFVLENDSDADGDRLYINEVTSPSHGTVTNYGHSVVYEPNPGYSGPDSFSYTILDVDNDTNVAKGGSDTALVTLNVGQITNEPPVAIDDSYQVEIGVETTFDVVANDTDADNDALFIIQYTLPLKGTLEIENNKFTYTANSDAVEDDSFTYKITDNKGGESSASVFITFTSVNKAPVANDDNVTTQKNNSVEIDVLSNDVDADGDVLFIQSFNQPANGVVENQNDKLLYMPNVNYVGQDTFSYQISDGNGGTSEASVSISVNELNSNPVASDDNAETNKNVAVSIDVLSNDSDIDNDELVLTNVGNATNGQTVIAGMNVIYTPNNNFVGSDSFNYVVSDGNGGSDTGSVSVLVKDVNVAPVANDDNATIYIGEQVIIDVLANDEDENGDVLTVIDVESPANGLTSIVNNKVAYDDNSSTLGNVVISYTISDGLETAIASITINVVEKPDEEPSLAILSPQNGHELLSGTPLLLQGSADDVEDGNISDDIIWTSDKDGQLGVGQELNVVLSDGEHAINASVEDSSNNRVETSINVKVIDITDTTFSNNSVYNIPDNKGYGVTSNIDVPVELNYTTVRIALNVEHNRTSDLALQLIGPNNRRFNLANPGNFVPGKVWVISTSILTSGTWKLKISDQKKDFEGKLNNWSISFE